MHFLFRLKVLLVFRILVSQEALFTGIQGLFNPTLQRGGGASCAFQISDLRQDKNKGKKEGIKQAC